MRKMNKSLLLAGLMTLGYVPQTMATQTQDTQAVQQQQTIKVTGNVQDAMGAIIGASVIEKGTSNGVVTDFDGNFTLTVKVGAQLEISYIGYKSQTIEVGNQREFNITLKEDNEVLEEVVVVGYGVQKKKLVTGATVQVKGDDVAKLNTTSALGALQSQTPGVNITANNGQPGEGFKVNIRGLGTVGDSEPLYVIDGVAGGDINTLNPADIESIDVLKDAASAAIYGSRAANGVILVTTKQGKSGKMQVSYDGYYGWQNLYRKPALMTVQQNMAVSNAAAIANGNPLTDWQGRVGSRVWNMIQNGWEGTDWVEEMRVKNATTTNHAINLAGGSDMSNFSAGVSYTKQNGILGKPVAPEYERYTARLNSQHVIFKGVDRDIVKFGENMTFYYSEKTGIAEMMAQYNDVRSALTASRFLPMYNKDGGYYMQSDKDEEGWTLSSTMGNPIAQMVNDHGNNLTRSYGLNATAYLEVEPLKGLKYRGSYSYRMQSNAFRSYITPYAASTVTAADSYSVYQTAFNGHNIAVENTVAYVMPTLKDVNLDFLVGQSFEKVAAGDNLEAQNFVPNGQQLPTLTGDRDHAWLGNANNVLSSTTVNGYPTPDWSLASFFGRANLNYAEKYMATLILRADGSSNFARGHRWGYFPSASAGWVVSSEKFMEKTASWLDFLKVRFSWGKNGNQSISNFQYVSPIAFDQSHVYNFGQTVLNTGGTKQTGAYAKTLANPDVTWETSEQYDLGLDAAFLSSRLRLAFDYYIKYTKDWLVQVPVLDTAGAGAPYINGGDVRNSGFEVGLTWNDRIGRDFNYSVNLNLSYNKNEVTRIANEEGIIHGAANVLGVDSPMTEFYRAQVGYPIGYFWGYKTAGVFQNQQEIDAWRQAGNGFCNASPAPGDLKYVDLNHDGKIDEQDKTQIGNPHPDFRLGFSLSMNYKGLDLSLTTHGAFGHQLYYSYRNLTTDSFDFWQGEGTSYKRPSQRQGSSLAGHLSDLDLEDGDFWKIQNLTIGYDFKRLFPMMPLQQARIYVSAQNLYTFTKYPGMDPEVGFGGTTSTSWVQGVDIGSYPAPRTFLIGVNLKY